MCVIWFVYHFMTSRSLLNSSKSPSSGVRNQRLYALSLQLIGGAVAIFGIYLLFISGQGIFWLVAVVGLATLIDRHCSAAPNRETTSDVFSEFRTGL